MELALSMKPLDGLSVIQDESMLASRFNRNRCCLHPTKIKLMEQAEAAGATAINGLGMMLWQGALAFELWTGQQMPVDFIKEQLFAE